MIMCVLDEKYITGKGMEKKEIGLRVLAKSDSVLCPRYQESRFPSIWASVFDDHFRHRFTAREYPTETLTLSFFLLGQVSSCRNIEDFPFTIEFFLKLISCQRLFYLGRSSYTLYHVIYNPFALLPV